MSTQQAIRDVARRPDRPATRRPLRHRPAPELERRRRGAPPSPSPSPGIAASSASVARASARQLRCRARASSATSIALRPPAPVPRMTAISSAADSPPGPRRASRSRGRSAAGRSRTDRLARRCAGSIARPLVRRGTSRRAIDHLLGCGRGRSTASCPRARRPRVRTTEARRFPPPSGSGNTTKPTQRPLPGAQPATCPQIASTAMPARCRSYRPNAAAPMTSDHLDRVERRVQPDRRVQRPPGEEHPAERDPDGQQRDRTRTARAARPSRTRRRTGPARGRSRRTARPG